MTDITTGTVTSADGTSIAFDRSGTGPPVIFVHGALTDRTFPVLTGLAAALAPRLTVFNYDRRGRGDSGDTLPYAVQREIEDIDALIQEAGGAAMVFGGSSGAALALEAAAAGLAFSKLALWEPPYHVDQTAPVLPDDFGSQLADLVRAGRRGDAVALFMTKAAEIPAGQVAWMRAQPSWPETEAVGHTIVYEAEVMGPGNALPAGRIASVRAPTLVLNGGNSPAWMTSAGRAVAGAVPGAIHRMLEGQSHNPAPGSLAPELLDFFVARCRISLQ